MLEHSFDIQNPYDKLSYIIETYDNFIPLIESFREEKFVEEIKDEEFLQTFKKRKLS